MKIYETISEAYLGTLADVYYNPDVKSSPRGQACREKLDYTFRVLAPDSSPIVTKDTKRNSTIESYTAKEVALYDSCTNSAQDFGNASKFWLSLANPDGTVNSAYGHLIWSKKSHGSGFETTYESHPFWDKEQGPGRVLITVPVMRTPWEWAKESLINDKDTRQAILRFSLPEHQWMGNKDQTCTMHGNFLIRNDKLHFSVVMRSNDLTLGLVYDLPWFCGLMDKMVEELKPNYPDLQKGHYTHTVHSLHIYERNEEMVKKMIGEL
jgi:thymidylate synthase